MYECMMNKVPTFFTFGRFISFLVELLIRMISYEEKRVWHMYHGTSNTSLFAPFKYGFEGFKSLLFPPTEGGAVLLRRNF